MQLAVISCTPCRSLKRKCSKELPACSLCRRVGRDCEYPQRMSGSANQSHVNGNGSSDHNRSLTNPCFDGDATGQTAPNLVSNRRYNYLREDEQKDTHISRFPAAWFIDSIGARGCNIRIPNELQWADIEGVSHEMSAQFARDLVDQYFSTVHKWLPIVSMKRMARFLSGDRPPTSADSVALFVAMALLWDNCGISSPDNPYYGRVKAALSACEQRGQYTTNLLAAEVLIAVYEIGHGIYPAAYITIGTCARICYTFGLHNKRLATQLPLGVDTWTEIEEHRRLWWATILLDRYVNIRYMFRPLSIPTIPPNEILPADDAGWDEGELSVNPLLVMSIESQTKVSPFARTCQAAHLLGRVCQHLNEHADPSDDDFHFQEAHQIQRAASALLAMLDQEYRESRESYKLFSAIALCSSALLSLYDIHSCIEIEPTESGGRNRGMRLDLQQLAIDGYKEISSTILEFAGELRKAVKDYPDWIPPFVGHCLYVAGFHYAWVTRETGNESSLSSLNDIRATLRMLKPTWSVTGDYLELLKGTEHHYRGGCTQ